MRHYESNFDKIKDVRKGKIDIKMWKFNKFYDMRCVKILWYIVVTLIFTFITFPKYRDLPYYIYIYIVPWIDVSTIKSVKSSPPSNRLRWKRVIFYQKPKHWLLLLTGGNCLKSWIQNRWYYDKTGVSKKFGLSVSRFWSGRQLLSLTNAKLN